MDTNQIKQCSNCDKTLIRTQKRYCSRNCQFNAMGRKPVIKCANCGKEKKIKKTILAKNKNSFCSKKCSWEFRVRDIDNQKKQILSLYNQGLTIAIIATELGISRARLIYHFHKWQIKVRRSWEYKEILKNAGKKRTLKAQEKFLSGRMSYQRAHKIARKLWRISDNPCQICGWDEAERDMHLIKPKVLNRENAISLCPNCHRLAHRGKIDFINKMKI